MQRSIPRTRICLRWLVAAFVLGLLFTTSCHRPAAQTRAYDQHATSPMHQQWARRLSGNWQRIDGQSDTYEATGAPTLRFDDKYMHHAWSDGQTLDTRWAAVQADQDVVHVAIQMPNRSAEIWRLYLYTPQELVVFAPGLPPATYRRGGSETAEMSLQTQSSHASAASSAQTAEEQLREEAQELLGLAPDPPSAPSNAQTPRAPEPLPQNPQSSPPPPSSSHVRHRPSSQELQAIYERIQALHHAMTDEDRRLGERLLMGTWELTSDSLQQVNAHAGQEGVAFEGIVLKFGEQERLSMIWKTRDETVSNGALWSIEGMYGTELRVILAEPNQAPNRERMQFIDVDHFVLDPEGERMIFERRD